MSFDMQEVTLNISDLYLRQPPFSFKAIKVGDIAFFNNGKAAIVERKIKPNNRGQAWYGLQFQGYGFVYDTCNAFDTSGHCANGSCMDIKFILKARK